MSRLSTSYNLKKKKSLRQDVKCLKLSQNFQYLTKGQKVKLTDNAHHLKDKCKYYLTYAVQTKQLKGQCLRFSCIKWFEKRILQTRTMFSLFSDVPLDLTSFSV